MCVKYTVADPFLLNGVGGDQSCTVDIKLPCFHALTGTEQVKIFLCFKAYLDKELAPKLT